MSALPKAVQKQVDEANAIIDDMNKTPEQREAEAAAAANEPAAAPAAEPTTEPPVPSAGAPVVPEPAPAAPAAPVAAEPAPAPAAESGPEHKYKVLQGKYNAEVPRLQKKLTAAEDLINEMRQRINNTESLLASMQTTAAPAAAPPAAAPAPTGITEEERVQFGPDLIDVIERVAEAKLQPGATAARLDGMDQRFQQVEQNASHTQQSVARSDRDKVLDALEAAVPNWEQQNENEDFLQWLNGNDAYAGVPRGRLLTEAFQSHDAVRVIAIFKGFQTENAVVNPSEPAPVVTPPEPQATLDDYVAPGTPKTGTTSAPNESGKRVWTREDIARFYASKNEFAKKRIPVPDEYVKLEKDLIAAQREGRLR